MSDESLDKPLSKLRDWFLRYDSKFNLSPNTVENLNVSLSGLKIRSCSRRKSGQRRYFREKSKDVQDITTETIQEEFME